jgi:hypothetical protein
MLNEANGMILTRMLQKDFYLSPYRFAMWAYGWGKDDLKHFSGPRQWQREVMEDIEAYLIQALQQKAITTTIPDFFRMAIASGRGPGKSALVGMLAHWFISTRVGGSVWVAANGEPQLRTKTFPEIAKWVARGINAEFFDINSTSIQPSKWFKEYIESPQGLGKNTRYYYANGQLWSAENPDAFAGAHNFDGEMAIFDEASGIPDPIWTVQEGVFTEATPDRFWLAFSNPRVSQGAFFECFNRKRDMWRNTRIDSRSVEGISHHTFDNIIKQYGEDSDEARVEVYGQFPNVGENQFIGSSVIRNAMTREVEEDAGAPLLMGVDVARFGDDRSVIAFRKGRDARSIPWHAYKGIDTVQLVGHITRLADKLKPDAIFVDGGGVGGGVVDQLKSLKYKVIEVQAGSKADDTKKYLNKRVELWDRAREWVQTGCLPDDDQLIQDATNIKYSYSITSSQLQLERKEEMKKRGLASPDKFEALCQTFAKSVNRRDVATSRHRGESRRVAKDMDYALFG